MTNLLLNKEFLKHNVEFDKITPNMFSEAFDILIPLWEEEFENILNAPLTYKDLSNLPNTKQLTFIVSYFYHLTSVMQSDELRKINEKYSPIITQISQKMNFDVRHYNQLKQYILTEDFKSQSELRKKAIFKAIENLEINGIHLPETKKKQYQKLLIKLDKLQTNFSNNLIDTNKLFQQKFKKDQLKGLNERQFNNLKDLGNDTFLATEIAGNYDDILMYCENSETRKIIYEDCIKYGNYKKFNNFNMFNKFFKNFDNTKIAQEIVNIKTKMAKILNFENHAFESLKFKMAKNPNKVIDFLTDLGNKSYNQAKEENEFFENYGKNLLNKSVEFHDRSFVRNKLKQEKYSINEEEIRKYFPINFVLDNFFDILNTLFNVKFIENKNISKWHNDVIVYDVFNDNEFSGRLYLDLFKRENKQDGAWMNGIVRKHDYNDEILNPISYIVMNVPKDSNNPTFSFNDVITLFHETGHALHHLLTKVTEETFSGLGNVEWDAVEFPSQFMENFCYDFEILKKISNHIDTNQPLSKEIHDKLILAKNFMSANSMLRQVKMALLDMNVYNKQQNIYEIENEIYNSWKVNEIDFRSIVLTSFSHILTGGYSAGYYSYLYAEVLSADAFAALKEEGNSYLNQKNTANLFKTCILETGGENSMMDNFIKFRNRKPDITFLLNDYNILT